MTIKTNAQAALEDQVNHTNIIFDVNFDEKYKECVQISIAGHKAVLKYSDLFSFMFVLATPEVQRQMIPSTSEEVRAYDRQHRIELQQDMKKGEVVFANCRIHIPTILEEAKKNDVKE